TTPKRLVSPANQPHAWRERSERHPNVEFASISEICEIRGRYFGEAPNARSAKRKASTASFSPNGRRPPNVAGEQRTTHKRRICFNQRDLRNPREILWRSPKRTKCQTKSEDRELFTNRPKATKRGGRAANDTQPPNLPQPARSAKSAGDTLAKPQTHEVPNEKRAPRAFHQPAEGHQTCREHSERHPNGW